MPYKAVGGRLFSWGQWWCYLSNIAAKFVTLGGICMGAWLTVTGNQSFAFKAKSIPILEHPRWPKQLWKEMEPSELESEHECERECECECEHVCEHELRTWMWIVNANVNWECDSGMWVDVNVQQYYAYNYISPIHYQESMNVNV